MDLFAESKWLYRALCGYYHMHTPRIPQIIQIETTNRCNLSCGMCARKTMTRSIGDMSLNRFIEIITDASNMKIKRARLQFYGEPLLNENIIKMVAIAKSHGLMVDFDTNGILLTKDTSSDLISAGLDEITISLHGMTEEDYKSVHGTNKFSTVINNINSLILEKERVGSKKPHVIIQSALMDRNQNHFNRIRSLFSAGAVDLSLVNCGFNPHVHHADYRVNKKNYKRDLPCTSLYQMLAVSWDGRITACCMDVNFELQIGTIEEGLTAIWHGKKLKLLRDRLRKNKYPELCKYCIDPVTSSNERNELINQ